MKIPLYGAKITGRPTAEKRDDAIGLLLMAAEEIWQAHRHHYADCMGGCPAEDILKRIAEATGEPQPHTRSDRKLLTQLEFRGEDFEQAEKLAAALGYKQTAYTSTSDLIGLFCLPENPEHSKGPTRGGCVIKTQEFGLMFTQDAEDIGV